MFSKSILVNRWLKNNLKGDPIIWAIALVLAIFSILLVYSAVSSLAYRKMQGNTEYYLIKHTSLVLISLGAMWVVHKVDYRYFSGLARIGLWVSVPLLLLTWRYGIKVNEASRWINIPIINRSFQPSDLAQLALIIRIAAILARNQGKVKEIKKVLVPILTWTGITCGLIALTNFSAAFLLFFTCVLMMYFGRVPTRYLATLGMVTILVTSLSLLVGQRGKTVLSRIKAFQQQELPFQTQQAYIAIATGGIYGKGPGKSIQKNLLPYSYADFIYAIVIEEYGIVGGMLVIILYIILLYRGTRLLTTQGKLYPGLVATGLSFFIAIQALVNMGIAVGLGPVTGLQLPFISMGGTSLLFTGIALGMILSTSQGEIDEHIKPYASATNRYKAQKIKLRS